MDNLNTHIEQFLEYYCNLSHPPQYAVLINGPWGAGKTRLIERFFDSRPKVDDQNISYLYVSLYGMRDVKEINDALFTQLHPLLGSRGMRIAGRIMTGLLKASLKIDLNNDGQADGTVSSEVPNIDLPDYVKKAQGLPVVFDDLERCSMKIKEVLGYINGFSEHDDCKVIILADDTKIGLNDEGERIEYGLIKEKLIGKTFEVRPEFDAAYKSFVAALSDPDLRRLFTKEASEIRLIFEQSKSNNLRTLQRAIWDFERLCKVLLKKHINHKLAMRDIIRVFFAFSFEIKTRNLKLDEVQGLGGDYWSGFMGLGDRNNPSEAEKIRKRYPEVPFDQTLIGQSILSDILSRSIVGRDLIVRSINEHKYFASNGKEPSWRVLWDAERRDEDVVSAALDDFESDFTSRRFVELGEVLHIIGIRLWMSDMGILSQKKSKVVEELKKYVDDLLEQGSLSPDQGKLNRDVLFGGYAGLGYRETDSSEFKEVSAYIEAAKLKKLRQTYPEKASKLMVEMAEDANLYFQRLCLSNGEHESYHNIPILTFVKPEDFVKRIMSLSPSLRYSALSVFKPRYENPHIVEKISEEIPWLAQVKEQLSFEKNKLGPIQKSAVSKWIELFIQPVIESYTNDNGASL